jgi:hypothetical protein
MNSKPARDEQGNATVRTFENNGLLYGGLFGVLLGVLISGPHFNEWSVWAILATSAICALIMGLICHFAFSLMLSIGAAVPADFDDYSESESNDYAQCVLDD